MKTYQILARAIGARNRCITANNKEWEHKHQERIDELLESFPSGSGFDNGTKLDDDSTPEKLIFHTAFHHMDEGGGYDGWTQHQVIVTPALEFEFHVRITGRDRNQIKEYIHEMFDMALNEDQPQYKQAASVAV